MYLTSLHWELISQWHEHLLLRPLYIYYCVSSRCCSRSYCSLHPSLWLLSTSESIYMHTSRTHSPRPRSFSSSCRLKVLRRSRYDVQIPPNSPRPPNFHVTFRIYPMGYFPSQISSWRNRPCLLHLAGHSPQSLRGSR